MLLKGTATAEGTTHGNTCICSITILCLEGILEGTLLGSFHWRSNEEIPTLTLTAECAYLDCNHTLQFISGVHPLFLCKLVCCISPRVLDQSWSGWENMGPLGVYFWIIILVSWYFYCGGNGSINSIAYQDGHLGLTRIFKLWEFPIGLNSIIGVPSC